MTTSTPSLSKSQRAYQWIRERITAQEFKPGHRLVLGAIAEQLDMSVVPVREAIRQLEAEGMVTFERNVGARVSVVDATQYGDSMHSLGILEAAATALSAPHATPEDLTQARAINTRLAEQLKDLDPHEFTRLNHELHATLTLRCRNHRLMDLVRAEWSRLGYLRDSTFSFVPERAADSVREHEQLIELIESSAPLAEIEAAARHHRVATLDAYLARTHPELIADLPDF